MLLYFIYFFKKKRIEITRACQTVQGKPLRTKWESASTETIENLLSDYDALYLTTKRSGIDVNKLFL